ncbi:MAG: Flp pilus assembly complex ATPase component TadA [Actinobacteria bacterium]|nr:Flp pilus assembly complex ATPase component TadA [Actinomycetota bacterium]
MTHRHPAVDPASQPAADPVLRAAVEQRLLADAEVAAAPGDRSALRRAVARALAAEGIIVAPARWATLVRDLVDDLGGLGPLETLLRDPDVTDVLVNGPCDVWVERRGVLAPAGAAFRDEDHVTHVLQRVLGPLGVRLDRAHPWADAVLDGGVRLHAVIPPLAPTTALTLRRVATLVPTWGDLEAAGTVQHGTAAVLHELIEARRNVVISGPAGVGKTTLLSRLVRDVGGDRVVIIEDVAELDPGDRHAVMLRTTAPTPDGGAGIGLGRLVRNALRMRPDRLVIGEVRGAEVADLLQAMNTGHAGSMTTVHANSAEDALVRLEGMALLAGIPVEAARAQVATAVDAVVSLARGPDGTRQLAEIVTVEAARDRAGTRPRARRVHP